MIANAIIHYIKPLIRPVKDYCALIRIRTILVVWMLKEFSMIAVVAGSSYSVCDGLVETLGCSLCFVVSVGPGE